jgi:4-hydroxybenzoate polyprenyltransferase
MENSPTNQLSPWVLQFPAKTPLIVDLDGTLIKNDLTWELIALAAKYKPLTFPLILIRLVISKAPTKRWLTECLGDKIGIANLPYERTVLNLIEEHGLRNGKVELVSGSDEILVSAVAKHLGSFTSHKGSDGQTNLTGKNKADYLTARYEKDFVYLGNSSSDHHIWSKASGGVSFNGPDLGQIEKNTEAAPGAFRKISLKEPVLSSAFRAMRLHQWAKNILLFVVPGLILFTLETADYLKIISAFILFGLLASATYILNDLFDLNSDRQHATKKHRPLASGDLPVPAGIMLAAALLVISVLASGLINQNFQIIVIVYTAMTLLYSFRLKKIAIVDVLVLAFLFSLRVVAGALVIGATISNWLVCFVMFFFLSLALAKRYIELKRQTNNSSKIIGRGYQVSDADIVRSFGTSAGMVSVLSIVIYSFLAPDGVIASQAVAAGIALILATWIMRLWLLADRGIVTEDPIVFAIKDKTSILCVTLIGALVILNLMDLQWLNL